MSWFTACSLAEKINRLFEKMSLVPFSESDLDLAIERLSDNAKEALEEAIRDKDTRKLSSILGLKKL